jgi:hypothetical protein
MKDLAMPDLDLILQVEQGMLTFGCRGNLNLTLLHNSGVPTVPRSRRVDGDEGRIGSLVRQHAFSRKSKLFRCRIGRHQTPEIRRGDRHFAAPLSRNLDA